MVGGENFSCLSQKCTRPRVENERFCLQHFKPSRDSACKQCNYTASRSGKRCFQYTLRTNDISKESFCVNHCRLTTYLRRRSAFLKRFRNTPDSLLENVKDSYKCTFSSQSGANNATAPNNNDLRSRLLRSALDYYSESSDDEQTETVADSQCASIDSDTDNEELEDPLRHAGAYTADEVIRISIEKMSNLRQSYIEYLKLLNRRYKINRSKYLRKVKFEGEYHGSLSSLIKNHADRKKMLKLRALRRYGKYFGKSALLRQQSKTKRKSQHVAQYSAASNTADESLTGKPEKEDLMCKAMAAANNTQCTEKRFPASNLCKFHILSDERQLLFKKCDAVNCHRVVFACGQFASFCWLHKPSSSIFAQQ